MKEKERGFITMATGAKRYYEVAHNLLVSYRFFSRKPLPFAIICEEENEFTADFDRVILIEHPIHSFLDKLRIPGLAPFDETIFIDSDCLAYRDLNGLWSIFSHAGTFSYLGYLFPFKQQYGWFQREGAGVFRDEVKFSIILQGGIYYMRKGKLADFSRTCQYILDHYDTFVFSRYPYTDPVDEPVFALASSVHDYRPARGYEDVFCYYPVCHSIRADIRKGQLSYRYKSTCLYSVGRYFLHWSMKEVDGTLYRQEIERLAEMVSSGKHPSLFQELRNRFLDIIPTAVMHLRQLARKCLPLKFKIRLAALLRRQPRS